VRIGLSLVDLAPGGAQTFLVQLAAGLVGRGHTLCYYLHASPSDPQHVSPALLARLQASARAVSRPAELGDCDVIQLDGYHSLRRKLPYLPHWKRCAEIYHSLYSVRRAGPLYPPQRVAVSERVRAAVPGRVQVIYQGIPLPPFPPTAPRRYEVGILGRMHPVKGHLLFLQACEELFHRRGRLKALVLGEPPPPGPYRQQLEAEIERLRGLGLSLHTPGGVPPEEVPAWLRQVRVLLVTSRDEGFGRMALEALACGAPVVANPVGGLPEIVRDGEEGFLARRDDPASFAALAARLLEDEDLRSRLGRQGRRRVEEHFSLERMLDAYEALYREIMGA